MSKSACGQPLQRGGTCQMSEGHWADKNADEKGHGKPDYWRRPEKCPYKDSHYEHVYEGRWTKKCGALTRDGVVDHLYIDGVKAEKTHTCLACQGCELYIVWVPK